MSLLLVIIRIRSKKLSLQTINLILKAYIYDKDKPTQCYQYKLGNWDFAEYFIKLFDFSVDIHDFYVFVFEVLRFNLVISVKSEQTNEFLCFSTVSFSIATILPRILPCLVLLLGLC